MWKAGPRFSPRAQVEEIIPSPRLPAGSLSCRSFTQAGGGVSRPLSLPLSAVAVVAVGVAD
jgi:hypothetical protein